MQPIDEEPGADAGADPGADVGADPGPDPGADPRPYWPWIAGLVVLTLLAAGGAVWLVRSGSTDSGAPARRTHSSTPTTNAAADRLDAVTALLNARARAVLRRDKAAFLAQIDPGERAFRARQARLFDRVTRVRLAGWDYDYSGEGPGLSPIRAAALPHGSWIARVTLHFTYAGADTPVDREQYLTLVPRAGRWLIAGDHDGRYSGLETDPDLWDLGSVRVVRGERSLVIGDASRRVLRQYADDADRSVRDVRDVWRAGWSRRPVVVVPRTQRDMARIIGSDGEGLDQIAAVTTGFSDAGPTRGNRVVVNPSAYRTLGDLGRRVVMTHEMTHLATRESTRRAVPIWLSEGFADYVAYEAVDVPTSVVAEDVLDAVRKGKVPHELPDDADFDAARGDLAPAYEGSWLACRMIAERYGERRLVGFYRFVAGRTEGSYADDIKRGLGVDQHRFVRQWRAYLRGLAAR